MIFLAIANFTEHTYLAPLYDLYCYWIVELHKTERYLDMLYQTYYPLECVKGDPKLDSNYPMGATIARLKFVSKTYYDKFKRLVSYREISSST